MGSLEVFKVQSSKRKLTLSVRATNKAKTSFSICNDLSFMHAVATTDLLALTVLFSHPLKDYSK